MSVQICIPPDTELEIEHLLLDQNGTLSYRGELLDGVEQRLRELRERLEVHILTADTFGTLHEVTAALGVRGHRVSSGAEKRAYMDGLHAGSCAAVGNGSNDVAMLQSAALGIAVIGPEGMSAAAGRAAQLVCPSILTALDLLLEPQLITATLRG